MSLLPKRIRGWGKFPSVLLTESAGEKVRRTSFKAIRETFFRHVFVFSPFQVCPIILLMISMIGCSNLHSNRSSEFALQLFPAHPQRQALSTNHRHTYIINLTANQCLRLSLEQNGIDVGLTLYEPTGSETANYQKRADGQTTISFLAEKDGAYHLEVRALETTSATGNYELKIEEIQTATPIDQERITGQKKISEGERLKAKYEASASQSAIEKYKEASQHFLNANQGQEAAQALKIAGEIHLQLGEPRLAQTSYEQARSILPPTPGTPVESDLLSALSYVHLHLGDYFQALDDANRALEIGRVICDQRREAQALLSLSEVHYSFGNRWKAREYAQQACSLNQRLGDRRKLAQGLLSLGFIDTDLGEASQARNHLDRTFVLYRTIDDKRGQALTRIAQASLKAISTEWDAALSLYEEARLVIQSAGERYWEASILQNTGTIFFLLNNLEKGRKNYEQALEIWKEIENPAEYAGALSAIGDFCYSSGDKQSALTHFQKALAASKALSDRKYQSNPLRKIGKVHNSLGDKVKAISYYREALALHQASGERQGEGLTLKEIGKLYVDWRRFNLARARFNQALAIDRSRGDKFAESETLYQLASLEAVSGHPAEARSYIENALAMADAVRKNVASQKLRVTYFASVQRYFEFFVGLLMDQYQQNHSADFAAEALTVSERARARSLLELLAEASTNIRQGIDPALIEQTRQLQKQISDLAEEKIKLLRNEAPEAKLADVSLKIENLSTKRDEAEMLIRKKNPHYAALTQPQPLSALEIQRLLDSKTMLLVFSLGEKRSYVWAVTESGVKGYELPGRAEIEKAARDVYEVLAPDENAPVQLDQQRTAEYWKKANTLSQKILGPVATQLDRNRLVVVADGLLQYIPFSALPKPQAESADGKQVRNKGTATNEVQVPMIRDHEIVYLPSASTLAVLRQETAGRRPAPKAIAVLADPVFEPDDLRLLANNEARSNWAALGDPTSQLRNQSLTRSVTLNRLRGTLEEATAIEQLTNPGERFIAKGFDATLQQATSSELSQYRIIHFATHGVLDDENPELSALVFSLFDKQGKSLEGRLWLQDIYNLNLPAELVVLSACDTGLGKEFKGEGLVGLTRGFMYAGAPRVMASLWKVRDEPTAQLMRRFYLHLLKDKLRPAAALRQAQLDLFHSNNWNAPYFWGSFVLQGEWQ